MSTQADASTDSPGAPGINYRALTFALMGGATVWLLRLIVNASLVTYSCRISSTWPLWLTAGITTLIGVVALGYAWRFYKMTDEAGNPVETARWLGLLGVLFNITAIAGIILETAPVAVLDICPPA